MRQANGTGSYFKMKGNRRKPWRVRVTDGFVNGKQKFIELGTYATRQEAILVLAKYNENPWDTQQSKLTFAELYDMWFKTKEKTIDVKNARNINSAYKHTTSIQDMIFKDIKTVHLQNVIDAMTLSKSSKLKVKQIYKYLYTFALQNDIVSKDYAAFVKVEDDEEETVKNPFTNEEIIEIYNSNGQSYEIIKLLIFTGFRINELLHLKNENIHLDNGYMFGGSKTPSGKNRLVPISKFIKPIIERLYDPNNEYLLLNDSGERVKYNTYYDWWKKNIEGHTAHDTRHTFISIMNRAEVNKISYQRICGHKSVDVTDKIYTHKTIEDLKKAMDQFDNFMDGIEGLVCL